MANGVAPVCPISRSQLVPPTARPLIPAIRRTTDPAVNQIADVVEQVRDRTFTEDPGARITQRVRIHNPDDFEQWVEVERITRLVLKSDTGATIEWTYKPT
jgi:hypothetical protein